MDAPDDQDLKLYRNSADLLAQISVDLPRLLWRSSSGTSERLPRKWISDAHVYRTILLFEPFQEWPQLLDPQIRTYTNALIDAFLDYLNHVSEAYWVPVPRPVPSSPLPRAVCKLLYTLCKIRGVKVISNFFKNDAQLLQPMLEAFIGWETSSSADSASGTDNRPSVGTWEERYIMLLWLSHLLLTPFDLESLASEDIVQPSGNVDLEGIPTSDLPQVAISILQTSMKHIRAPGKEREAATALLVRLCLRPDMQKAGLLKALVDWSLSVIGPRSDDEDLHVYGRLGALSFLSGLLRSAHVRDILPFLNSVFQTVRTLAIEMSAKPRSINASASARKLVVKILKSSLVIAITAEEDQSTRIQTEHLTVMMEECIEYFLNRLADKDTPVRFAASKALSIVTHKLDTAMAANVVEAVIDSLGENLLLEDPSNGQLVAAVQAGNERSHSLNHSLSGVDPLKWQGLMLSLAQLLYRRSPPPDMLSQILTCLVSGLEFEQRSSTGSSIGTGVRDAACFGMWALARKYTTAEIQALDQSKGIESELRLSTMHIVATALILSGCTDPSGNIRRGSSAALQELIGRHPDTVYEGIQVVQAVDYHAVALRSRAMIDVSVNAAQLNANYGRALLEALRGWRGIGSPDPDSRRAAASAIGKVSMVRGFDGLNATLKDLLADLGRTSAEHVESRHGLLLSLACVLEASVECLERSSEPVETAIEHLFDHVSWLSKMTVYINLDSLRLSRLRPHLLAEASSDLITALSKAYVMCKSNALQTSSRMTDTWQQNLGDVTKVLELCVGREEPMVIRAASKAASTFLGTVPETRREEMLTAWLGERTSARGRTGALAVYGAAFNQIPTSEQGRLHHVLCLSAMHGQAVETREAALRSLASGVLPLMNLEDSCIEAVVTRGLDDYTTDSRGDVGSLIRLEAINCVGALLQRRSTTSSAQASRLLPQISRLAAEKVDKVRFLAWSCLRTYPDREVDEKAEAAAKHMSHVSSVSYYRRMAALLDDGHVRLSTLQGLATSMSAGSESIIHASRLAVIQHLTSGNGPALVPAVFEDLLNIVGQEQREDRWLIPTLEVVGFTLAERIVPPSTCDLRRCFDLTRNAVYQSKSIPKIEAALRVYAGLLATIADTGGELRHDVLKRLTSMLLHSYPKIRNAAADLLFLHCNADIRDLTKQDWWVPPKELKPIVDGLRRQWGLRMQATNATAQARYTVEKALPQRKL